MANSLPEGWHTITPRLAVHEPAKLVKFLADAFGATGQYRSDRPSIIKVGDSILMVSDAAFRRSAPGFFYLYVDDADETYRRALAAGAVSIEAPADTPYGDRRAMIADPCGNDWQIATYRQPPPSEPV